MVSPMQIVSSRRQSVPNEAPGQPSSPELHRAVLAEVRGGSRVAVLGEDAVLADRLRQAGCEVLEASLRALGPAGEGAQAASGVRESLSTFRPELVVLSETWTEAGNPESVLRELAASVPNADLAIPFYNAASSTALVAALTGHESPRGFTEEQLQGWLTASGLKLRQRQVLQTAQLKSVLARDTERALRNLFQQLNPTSSAHQLLYWSRRATLGDEQVSRELVPGLLSVVMRNHSLERLKFLDHAIFALSCQDYQPLEIVIVSQCQDPQVVDALTALLEKYRPLGEFSFQVVHEPADTDIRGRLVNKGIAAANGQYIAFLDDDDVIYPQHYAELIRTLKEGTQAWAVGRIRRAFFASGPNDELYCRYKDEMVRGDSFDLAQLIHENYITCHAYVLDRTRVGNFQVSFAEEMSLHEDYTFLLRLCALFRPAFPPGVPSCEYRLRDDGSNSVLYGGSESAQREKQRNWAMSTVLKDAVKRNQQLLLTEQEFQDEMERTHRRGQLMGVDVARQQLQQEPRFQLIDKANTLLKQRGPKFHRTLKTAFKRLF